ncbi:MAG: L-threonylcarbamoyladenylate synthase [Firmicutes bacterium]|nr:L-threonylcarbamoyladenylate synthase [Bacillota bacterium]
MQTKIIKYSSDSIAEAAEIIKDGGIVAFKTETVYGLGADAYNARAVASVFAAKGRPQDNPLIVHLSDAGEIGGVAVLTRAANALAVALMPGAITMVLKKTERIPYAVTSGLETVAVRVPSDPDARAFIRACGVPIAAPSANLSGRPSPVSAQDVYADLKGRIPLILDGGNCEIGLESTVIDLTVNPPVILRPGGVSKGEIEKIIGGTCEAAKAEGAAKSPGMKYRHYAPGIPLEFYPYSERGAAAARARQFAAHNRVAILNASGVSVDNASVDISGAGSARLFSELRRLETSCDVIIAIGAPDGAPCADAVNNRLRKAAGKTSDV